MKGITIIFPIKKFKDISLKYNKIIGKVKIWALIEIATVFLSELGNLYNILFNFLLNNIIPKVAKNENIKPKS